MPDNQNKSGGFERNPSILSLLTKTQLVDFVEKLFLNEGSIETLSLDQKFLRRFIEKTSLHYRENPYHNFHHAVDTVNTIGWMISLPVFHRHLPQHHKFLLLFTALIHDIEHPGHNNQWEISIQSALAQKYQNEAVLEKHSLDVTRHLLSDPKYIFLAKVEAETVGDWMNTIEELVMSTDFAAHRGFLDDFGAYLENNEPDFSQPQFLSWITRALMKAADIANTSKPFPEAMVWGKRVMMEFWAQGGMEKSRNFPVGPLNDPETVKLNAAQAGFIRFAVLELFQLIARIEPGFQLLVDTLTTNLAIYDEMAQSGDDLFE